MPDSHDDRGSGHDTVLVVPCYNEADRLAPEAFLRGLDEEPRLRLRLVDDGSTDGTLAVLRRIQAAAPDRVRVTACAKNGGKAEAVRQGVLASLESSPALVGYWDADLATPLPEVSRFIARLDARPEVRVVLGSRVRLLGYQIRRKASRHIFGRGFATVVSTMLSLHVYDTQCGSKVFRATPELAAAFAKPFMSRWVFDVELLIRLMAGWERQGLEAAEVIEELPLLSWEDVAGSKVSMLDALRAIGQVGAIGRRYRDVLAARRRRLALSAP